MMLLKMASLFCTPTWREPVSDHVPVPVENRDRDYGQCNTYSNVISVNHPWLNLLTLNFGYHGVGRGDRFISAHGVSFLSVVQPRNGS